MGRTEPTVVKPPAAFRRDARAKRARATINKVIPGLLTAHPRARRGIESSELIVDPPRFRPQSRGEHTAATHFINSNNKDLDSGPVKKASSEKDKSNRKRKGSNSTGLGKAQSRRIEAEEAALLRERQSQRQRQSQRRQSRSSKDVGLEKKTNDAAAAAAASASTSKSDGFRVTLRVADTLTAAKDLLRKDYNHPKISDVSSGQQQQQQQQQSSSHKKYVSSSGGGASHHHHHPPDGNTSNKFRSGKGKVGILNMASPLSPGGGFLNGATSQEETLCMQTTLLPALRDEFYRLPELGVVYTPDVLVFRTSSSSSSSFTTVVNPSSGLPSRIEGGGAKDNKKEGKEKEKDVDVLPKADRWFVDVVSAAMLRLPETEAEAYTAEAGARDSNNNDNDNDYGRIKVNNYSDSEHCYQPPPTQRYASAADRELARRKMRAVMRVFAAKGCSRVVLGAWGCGAYGNPVSEIAEAWRRVLFPSSPFPSHSHLPSSAGAGPKSSKGDDTRNPNTNTNTGAGKNKEKHQVEQEQGQEQEQEEANEWASVIHDIVFAIQDIGTAKAFARAFGEDILPSPLPLHTTNNNDGDDEDRITDPAEVARVKGLRAKIRELEIQVGQVRSSHLREGLESVLAGLRRQMPSSGQDGEEKEEEEESESEGGHDEYRDYGSSDHSDDDYAD